jgi:hypothetical protein
MAHLTLAEQYRERLSNVALTTDTISWPHEPAVDEGPSYRNKHGRDDGGSKNNFACVHGFLRALANLEFELALRFGRVLWAFVGVSDQFEYGQVGVVHPIFQRVIANRTRCVTSVRHQEFLGSAMVLSAAIVTSDNCRHSENMRSG